ncbi:MAG: CHAP domain-containing protein [Oscillospiraceae bacterium]|nr:CHAP domain-containing protein [Oscillospiraceae bacterium]
MDEWEKRQELVRTAEALIGRKEADQSHREIIDVYNSIRPLPRGYRMRYEDPWCAAFVSAVGEMCGLGCAVLPECGCEAMLALYRKRGEYRGRDYDAQPGDLIFYNWDGNGSVDHVGIVAARSADAYTVIEGNLSDAVGSRRISRDWAMIAGFAVPDYGCACGEPPQETPGTSPAEPAPIALQTLPTLAYGSRGLTVKAMQGILIVRDCACGPDGADGEFGTNTVAALRRFQQRERLDVDGICGVKSWGKLLGLN